MTTDTRSGLVLRRFVRSALLHRRTLFLPGEIERRIDERDVRKRLREVAELASRPRVPFLGQQAELGAQVEQPLEDLLRLVEPSLQGEVVSKPERAGKECAFARRQSVDTLPFLVGGVAIDESVVQELTLDRSDGAHHARIIRGE